MIKFNAKVQAKFDEMSKTGKLFRVALTGQQIWDLYVASFAPQDNPKFRDPNSSTKNCNHCKNFIRRYGNIVSIDADYNIVTMFDVDVDTNDEYRNTVDILKNAIKNSKVTEVFFETFNELNSLPYESCSKKNTVFQLGVEKNSKRYTKEEAEKFGVVKPNEIKQFHHLHLMVDKAFVDMSGDSVESIMGNYRDAKNVFQRAMETISEDTLKLVKDLINQGSLLDGATHLYKIEQILPFKIKYDGLPKSQQDNFCWIASNKLPYAKFRNELIGTLCAELSEGEELNKACQSWNKRVDPANYMKATAPITKKQIEDAKQVISENGYEESFNRRFATIEDIKVSEILHSNVGEGKIKAVSVLDKLKPTSTSRHKRNEFDKVEEVSIENFMENILPACSSVEVLLLNSHQGNLASLTTANDKDSKKIFKWSNNYSWTFNGNLAGKSQIKEAVKGRGGKTEGCLNIRLHFPNTVSDYDLHVVEPDRTHIYYGERKSYNTGGMLDLDAQGMDGHFSPDKRVENVIYPSKSRMEDGEYNVFVNNYRSADSNHGFTIEVETENGDVTTFFHDKPIRQSSNLQVCKIKLERGEFTVIPLIPISDSNVTSKEIYGLETNQFHKVNLVCLSPNHWNGESIGNKHYFFMLDGCKSPTSIRSFHNENLLPELAAHRKVLEVLGASSMIDSTDKQLSGLGFNATVKDELIVRLQGSHKRVVKIKF